MFGLDGTLTTRLVGDLAFPQNNNSTFSGFSEENLMSIDTRGFKVLVQSEAERFLRPEQLLLNSTVTTVRYSANGVEVALVAIQFYSGAQDAIGGTSYCS